MRLITVDDCILHCVNCMDACDDCGEFCELKSFAGI
jgi:hypothetical protein